MDVDLRPVRKLRESAAARAALGPIIEAVCASPADLSRLRVVCDWIQYRSNFRDAVVSRPIGGTDVELAVDLRRCGDIAPDDLAGPGQAGAVRLLGTGPGALGARAGQLHLAVQRAVLAGAVGLGAGHRARIRAVPARRRERRAQHRGGPRAHPGALPALGRPRRAARAARRAVRPRARRREREPGPHLAGRVRPARPAARARLLPQAALPDGGLLGARARAGAPGRRPPRRAGQRAGRRGDPPGDHARLPGRQDLPGLHLQRVRQPAHRRGGQHPRAHLPGRDAGVPGRRGRQRNRRRGSASAGTGWCRSSTGCCGSAPSC